MGEPPATERTASGASVSGRTLLWRFVAVPVVFVVLGWVVALPWGLACGADNSSQAAASAERPVCDYATEWWLLPALASFIGAFWSLGSPGSYRRVLVVSAITALVPYTILAVRSL